MHRVVGKGDWVFLLLQEMGAAACGGAAWPPVLMGKVVALYLNGLPNSSVPCASNPVGGSSTVPGYVEFAMLHETLHGLGFVAEAPRP